MILTKHVAEAAEKTVGQKPLGENEIRKIDDMGGLYMTLCKLPGENDEGEIRKGCMEYWFQYSWKQNGVQYYFYGGKPFVEKENI